MYVSLHRASDLCCQKNYNILTRYRVEITCYQYSMCSLVGSTLDSRAVDRSSNLGSGKL